jgi:putative membrane protein
LSNLRSLVLQESCCNGLSEVGMRYFNWILRVVLFIALLGFAVKNDQPITLRYFFGYEWQSSLVLVLLIFFAVGAVVGVLAMFVNVLQQRREIAALQREIRVKNKLAGIDETQQAPR